MRKETIGNSVQCHPGGQSSGAKVPLGNTHLRMRQDHYVWQGESLPALKTFVSSPRAGKNPRFLCGIGTKYLERSEEMVIENLHDGTKCLVLFKQNGYWGASNAVSGTIYERSGEVLSRSMGSVTIKWYNNSRVLWRINSFPMNTHDIMDSLLWHHPE